MKCACSTRWRTGPGSRRNPSKAVQGGVELSYAQGLSALGYLCAKGLAESVVIGNEQKRVLRKVGQDYLVWALEHATNITAVSQDGLDRARLLCNRPDVGRVILNSIDPRDFADGVEDLPLSRPVIGSLAVFRNKKGLEVLLAAFHMILQRYPTAHLLLVGYVLDTEQQIFNALVTKYDLAGKFTLTGRIARRDALRYLRVMDVFAFSSLHDGCPNAVLEAMLAGLPIAASRAGALPQMIEHGKEGLLARPGSATELCEAMMQILSGEPLSRKFGQRAKERALTYFAPQRELDEYMQVYRDCLVTHRNY